MDRIMEIRIRADDERDAPEVTLFLPAMPYELSDAIERAGIGGVITPDIRICGTGCEFDILDECEPQCEGIYELNALAEKLSRMDWAQRCKFEGLVRMEIAKGSYEIGVGRLYDLASSVHCCRMLDVSTDDALGRYVVDNGFFPEYIILPDAVREKLDYAEIGKEVREAEGGVFIEEGFGYVTQESDMVEAFQHLDLTPKQPDYTVLAEIGVMDTGRTAMLKLPATAEEMSEALRRIGALTWAEVSYRIADCRIPALCDAIAQTGEITVADDMARELAKLTDEQAKLYKAVLTASNATDFSDAWGLLLHLDDYQLSHAVSSYEEMARQKLAELLKDCEVENLLPHLNTYGYGKSIVNREYLVLTDFGAVGRKDGQPIRQIRAEDAPEMGGMKVMQT